MEYRLGDEVMIVKKDNFWANIKSGNVKTGKLVFIRLLEENGKITDTSYANTKDGSNSLMLLGAKDDDGIHYSYVPKDRDASDYRFVLKRDKES